jgi:hypothetical protein
MRLARMQVSNRSRHANVIIAYMQLPIAPLVQTYDVAATRSDEEAADPLLVPPPILDPFVLYHLKDNATEMADTTPLSDLATKTEQ